jgi:branched-chain amino acid aminotransferase
VQILPYQNLSFSPAMIALHYGQAIFEGMKAYVTAENEVTLFRPWENFKRFNDSAERICMPTLPEELFIGGLTQLLQLDRAWVPTTEGATLYIRPVMFATDETVGMRPSDSYKFVIFCCPVGAYYSEPVRVKIETHFVRAVEGGTGYAKTAANYAASLYPFKLAKEEGYDQIIWTDGIEHKYVEESGTMNLIFKISGKIVTAELGDTILDGVTRKSVLALAQSWGYPVEERKVSVEEIITALKAGTLEEAFGVGTAAVVTPIKTIGYEGIDYDLKPTDEHSFSAKAKEQLVNLCKGKVTDEFEWIYKIPR